MKFTTLAAILGSALLALALRVSRQLLLIRPRKRARRAGQITTAIRMDNVFIDLRERDRHRLELLRAAETELTVSANTDAAPVVTMEV